MSSAANRDQLAVERAQREPIFFGLQFFLVLLGTVAFARYLDTALFEGADRGLPGRSVATVAIGAVFFTLLMRWRARRGAA